MADLTNSVNPLSWNVPIVDSRGNPTPEFQLKWEQQARANASIPDLTTAAAVSAVLDEIGATRGSLLSRGASQWGVLAIGGANTILHSDGTDPSWASLSSLMDTLGSARGDVLFRGAAGWTALVPGAAGNVLTTGGAGADPSWTAAAGGGAAVSSVNDDGTNFYMALIDVDGQLILDGSGDPVFIPETFPIGALPSLAPALTSFTVVGTPTWAPAATTGRARVRMKAAGGGGQGNGSTASSPNPGDGADASIVPATGVVTALTAKGGKGASSNDTPLGGTGGSNGSGWSPINIQRTPGAAGGAFAQLIWSGTTFGCMGGVGGGKGGGRGPHNQAAASAGAANSGGGGSGSGGPPDTQANVVAYTFNFAHGGAEGEEVIFDIINPAAVAAVWNLIVPDGGVAGVGTGTNAITGGKGGTGGIWIEEYPR